MSRSKDRTWLVSLRVAGLYLLSAALWIPLSDAAVNRIADNTADLTRLQTIKGWSWILLTSVLLYMLIQQALRASVESAARAQQTSAELETIMDSLPVILWTANKDLVLTSSRGKALADIGRKPDQDVGRNVKDVVAGVNRESPLLTGIEAVLDGQVLSYESELNGKRYDTVVSPLLSTDGAQLGILSFSIDVTERHNLLEQLRRSAADRDRLLNHLVRAEKDERERIASGIHDDSIQVMTSAAMGLDLLIQRLEDAQSRAMAERARASMSEAIQRLRTLVFDLKPVDLDRHGLAAGLREVLEQFHARADFEYEVQDRVIQGLNSHTRYAMFQIAREAIINACKHSSPSKIKVEIEEEGDGARVAIRDDGVGFDTSTSGSDQRHFGLNEMAQRAEVAGGWFRLTSEVGKGTTVEFWVPLVNPELQSEVDEMSV